MAFAVTKYKAYGRPVDQGLVKRFHYYIEMDITGLATDVDLDLGDTSTPGTFWTAALADGTYGDTATALLAIFKNIQQRASSCQGPDSTTLADYDRVSGAPALATEYQIVDYTNNIPNILFVSGGAPTSMRLQLAFALTKGEWPVQDSDSGGGI